MTSRRKKRDQDELRNAILHGEEVQIVLLRENYYDDKGNSWFPSRAVAELRTKGENDQWLKAPEMSCLNREENIDDAASLLRDLANWLEAGREDEQS